MWNVTATSFCCKEILSWPRLFQTTCFTTMSGLSMCFHELQWWLYPQLISFLQHRTVAQNMRQPVHDENVAQLIAWHINLFGSLWSNIIWDCLTTVWVCANMYFSYFFAAHASYKDAMDWHVYVLLLCQLCLYIQIKHCGLVRRVLRTDDNMSEWVMCFWPWSQQSANSLQQSPTIPTIYIIYKLLSTFNHKVHERHSYIKDCTGTTGTWRL